MGNTDSKDKNIICKNKTIYIINKSIFKFFKINSENVLQSS
jgi:hypothetical protein